MPYFEFLPDRNMNFQLNRALFEGRFEDLKEVAPKIKNHLDWKREMLNLAIISEKDGRALNAFAYYRAAEFFMSASDPDRIHTYEKFISIFYKVHKDEKIELHKINYGESYLHAISLKATLPKGDIVLHAGFDAYIEEFYALGLFFKEQGFNVYMFDGPGQGTTLIRNHIPMTHEWEKPVSAVLDYFKLSDVTLIGLSLGGYLAPRAAAFESRVKRVIAFDVFTDFLGLMASKKGKIAGFLLRMGVKTRLAPLINFGARRMMRNDLFAKWGIEQGMHVTGTASPYQYFRAASKYETKSISHLIKQDVLLMAGSEDHFVPLHQFYDQIETLRNTKSLTARLFTRAEGAQNHCQFGNVELALVFIKNWIDQQGAKPQ